MLKMVAFLITGIIVGFYVKNASGVQIIELAPYSTIAVSVLTFATVSRAILAVGLYGSVYGIDTDSAKKHRSIIISAVTFGVIMKSAIIGTGLYLLTGSWVAFLLGVTVAQIDPVAVSALLQAKKRTNFSKAGQTILRAWSSFDDPMTVLLAIYLLLPIVTNQFTNPADYFIQLGINIGFSVIVYIISLRLSKKWHLALLCVSLFIAIYFNLLLGIAIIGLFLRPPIEKILSNAVTYAFYLATFLLGTIVVFSVDSVLQGFALGVLAVLAQMIAAFIVAKKLSLPDKLHLAVAQYNGITAISLAIFIQIYIPTIGGTIAIAIIVINVLYYILNCWLHQYDKKTI